MMRSYSRFALAFGALGAFLAPAVQAQTAERPGCGTFRLFQSSPRIAAGAPGARIAKAAEGTSLSGRTLVTTHFAIHYSLGRNTHRPVWKTGDAGDALLKAQVDTVFNRYVAAFKAGGFRR